MKTLDNFIKESLKFKSIQNVELTIECEKLKDYGGFEENALESEEDEDLLNWEWEGDVWAKFEVDMQLKINNGLVGETMFDATLHCENGDTWIDLDYDKGLQDLIEQHRHILEDLSEEDIRKAIDWDSFFKFYKREIIKKWRCYDENFINYVVDELAGELCYEIQL